MDGHTGNRQSGRTLRTLTIGGVVLLVLGWLGSSAFAAWKLTARPSAPHEERLPSWLRAESLRLETRDGEDLGAWFHPGEPDRAVILFLHGVGGSRSSMALSAQRVAMEGNGFLALSLRGYGDSSGGPVDFGWSARADVCAAVDFIEERQPDAPVIVVGQSMGAATAIFAAGELGNRVDGYVLEAPYRDLEKACKDRLALRLVTPLDGLAYLGLRLFAPLFLPGSLASIRPIEHVDEFPKNTPVLFVAGSFDREAPVEDVRRMTELCSGRAELAVLDPRDHYDLWTLDERHWDLWKGFLDGIEGPRRLAVPH